MILTTRYRIFRFRTKRNQREYLSYSSKECVRLQGSNYSEHYKYDNFFNGYDHIQKVADKPNITLDKHGIDFEDFSIWSQPHIVEVISGKEREKLLNCEFFSSLVL